MPSTICTIDRDQRDGLYELVRNHLGAVGDIWVALEETEDYATAERLGIESAKTSACSKTSVGAARTTATPSTSRCRPTT
jgi:hypothetical protein